MAIDSEVGIYNLALNAVGERSNVSLPTENSRRAEVCNLWYETVRDTILEAAPWPEATEEVSLAVASEQTDDVWTAGEPSDRFRFAYYLPTDLLRPQYLNGFGRFTLGVHDNARRLYTSVEQASLVYTKRQVNISLWSSSLRMAVVYGLAAHISMPLSGKPGRSKMLADQANELVMQARINAANSPDQLYEHIPEWIAARGYSSVPESRFVFPLGSTLSVSNVN